MKQKVEVLSGMTAYVESGMVSSLHSMLYSASFDIKVVKLNIRVDGDFNRVWKAQKQSLLLRMTLSR